VVKYREFDKGMLTELADGHGSDGAVTVSDRHSHSGRWTEQRELVFEFDGRLYMVLYERGLTEMQYQEPFEYEPDMIKAYEVEPYEETVTKYRAVK
jgi:hypothetical protein